MLFLSTLCTYFYGRSAKMNALIVVREWDVWESLEKKLQARGYNTYLAENAEEALNLSIVVDFDLIITAAVLPEMTGFTLIERIVEGRKDLKIKSYVMVSRDEKLGESLCDHSGITSMIRQPITEDLLDQHLELEGLSSQM